MEPIASANEETIEAWNGVLFDRFVQFREIITTGLGAHGEEALRRHPPKLGDRVLDIGCGFGETTQQLAELVGTDGVAVGVDAAARFIEAAREEAERAGRTNLRFMVCDAEVTEFEQRFDFAFSRFGTMFFASPVAALRNVRRSLVPDGRLCMVVWRRKGDNEWLNRAETVVEGFVTEPGHSEKPADGPGPFSMADADTTSQILLDAGFEDITLHRCDIEIQIGRDLDAAVEFMMALGPAGELLRLAGEEAERIRPQIAAALREAVVEFAHRDGVRAPASTWIVGARAPRSG